MTLYDVGSTSKTFDYSNLRSILEHKNVLESKIELTETKILEENRQKAQFEAMLAKMTTGNLYDEQQNQFTAQRGNNIANIVTELDMVNLLENQRKTDIEVMLFQYKKELVVDHTKMSKIREQKEILLKNQEEGTKLIL